MTITGYKVFTTNKEYTPMYPAYVREALNAPRHHNQGHSVVVATSKAVAIELLEAQGFTPTKSQVKVADLRSGWLAALADANILMSEPGAIYVQELNGGRVVQVLGQREAKVIGTTGAATAGPVFIPANPPLTHDEIEESIDELSSMAHDAWCEGGDDDQRYKALNTALRSLRDTLENLT